MNAAAHISVDLDAGEIRLGARSVRLLAASAPHAFRLDNTDGPVVRALGFAERTLLLGSDPGDVARCIDDAALLVPGAGSDAVRAAVALALAGGAEETVSFAECAALAAHQEGWDWQRVREAPALVIDRLSRHAQASSEAEWNRIVFQASAPDLDALVTDMVENLLQRAAPAGSDAAMEPISDQAAVPQPHPRGSSDGLQRSVPDAMPDSARTDVAMRADAAKTFGSDVPAGTLPPQIAADTVHSYPARAGAAAPQSGAVEVSTLDAGPRFTAEPTGPTDHRTAVVRSVVRAATSMAAPLLDVRPTLRPAPHVRARVGAVRPFATWTAAEAQSPGSCRHARRTFRPGIRAVAAAPGRRRPAGDRDRFRTDGTIRVPDQRRCPHGFA